jgi:putative phosphoserine phosphatase/1-acylglycerol-3-phosphate O-acyltransferase
MASIDQLLEDIEAAPDGPQIAAIFDFDGTLIAGYSATAFIREQVRRGDLSPREFVELMRAMGSFGLGNLGFSGMMAVNAQFMRGIEEEAYFEIGEKLYKDEIARLIYPESRRLVQAHLAKGHTVAVISSATPYQVLPAARDLDIDNVLCTHLEVSNGRFTGAVVRPTCFGQGKVDAAEKLAAENGADLDQSYFYSDSTDDQLLLERVGRPRALNPGRKLERLARANQWPVAQFGSRGRPSVAEFVRSVAATSSLVTSFVAGLPIYALTGSRREANNFSFSLFADTASALVGMDLRVTGEEHLWSHRPAVFVFNHQSKADVIIIAKLLRRDIAGIGKKEIKSENPLIGRVLEMGGVVLIDRANSASAIEAITPLVDVMRSEGKSVVLAPEGTRTVSPRLAPFKKGAFHIAMQAGVPMIPIVIRNAGDVAPKGDFVFRAATVDVEILPPIDTSGWRAETVEDHVREVRNLFARALGQPEEKAPPRKRATKAAASRKKAAPKAGPRKAGPRKAGPRKAPAKKKTAAGKTAKKSAGGKAKAKAVTRKAPKSSTKRKAGTRPGKK